jgi:hypothetical protein
MSRWFHRARRIASACAPRAHPSPPTREPVEEPPAEDCAAGADPEAAARELAAAESVARTDQLIAEVLREARDGVRLFGRTSRLPIETLIEMAEERDRSSRLWIRTPEDLLWFDLRDGMLVRAGAQGDERLGERRGEMLQGMGFADTATVQDALRAATSRGLPLGAILLERGAVTRDQLEEALCQQSVVRFAQVLFAPEAAFALADVERSATDLLDNVAIPPRSLLLLGGQMMSE